MTFAAAAPWALLGCVVAQRLSELLISRRNTSALLAVGAREIGAAHYPLLILVHTGWIAALAWWLWRAPVRLEPVSTTLYLALQPIRVWVMLSLGRHWTTRIITLGDAPLVRRGPYRWVRHPNYVVVVAEVALLPLAFGAWALAVMFSILNGLALAVRVTAENRALTGRVSSTATATTRLPPASPTSATLR